MSGFRRALLAVGALVLLAVVALVFLLPRIAASDRVRARLTDAVSDAAGLPFRYASLDVGIFPVRLELRDAELGYEGAEPAARADRVELRMALLPLLSRTVLVDALVVEGVSADLIRRDGRVQLRGAIEEEPEAPKPPRDDTPPDRGDDLAFGVRSARVADARLTLEDDGARLAAGPLSADFSFGRNAAAPSGPFSLDLGPGVLSYRAAGDDEATFEKPAGLAARVSGTLELDPAGSAAVTDLALALGDLEAEGTATVEERTHVSLDAPPFDLAPLLALAPGASGRAGGRAELRGLSFATEPPTLGGAVALMPLELARDGRTLALSGTLEADGDRLVGDGMVARLGEFEAPVDLRISDLFGERALSLETVLEDADSAVLAAALRPDEDEPVLSGPLDLDADLAAAAGDPLATLGGKLQFAIAPGRLHGVSLLQKVVESAGLEGASREEGGLERFYDDAFESLAGSVRIREGVAHTDDLRLDYRDYGVDLLGTVDLDGMALDMTGTLTIEPALDAVLRGEEEGRRRVVPIAEVGGTVDSPRVRLTSSAIRLIAGVYATDERREKWERKIDKYLGEGSGRELLDALLSGQPSDEGAGAPPEEGAE